MWDVIDIWRRGTTTHPLLVRVGLLLLLLEQGVVVAAPAVAAVGGGGGETHLGRGKLVLAVGRGQRVAEQLGSVERSAGGVGGAGTAQRPVRQLRLRLRVIPQVVVGVGVARQRTVGGAASLERASASGGAGAAVAPAGDLGGGAAAAARAAGHRSAPCVALPAVSGAAVICCNATTRQTALGSH